MLRPAGRDLQTVPTSGNVSLVRAYRSDYNTAVHVYLSSNASRGARLTEQQIGSSLRTDLAELVSFPDLLAHPHLDIDVILTNEEEYRRHTPNRSWRRKGWTVEERRLIGVVDTLLISNADDLAALLPTGLPEPFSTADLAMKLGRSRRAAQQMAYCLRIADVIVAVGKKGNAVEYQVRGPRT